MRKLAIAVAALLLSLPGCKERNEAESEEETPAAVTEPIPDEDAALDRDAAEPPVLGRERVRLVEGGEPIREVGWSVPGGEALLRIEAGACTEDGPCEMQVVAVLGEETYELHRFGAVTPQQTVEAMLDDNGNPHLLLVSWESEGREAEANTTAVRLTWNADAGRPRASGTWEMPGADPDPNTIDLGEGH